MSDTAETGTGTEAPHGTEPEAGTDSTAETPTVEELLAKVEELTGASRKWEDRAKSNFEAKQELDKIRRDQMTDAEKAEADRAAIEQRVTDAEERAAKAEAALARKDVVIEFGLSKEDAEALEAITDEATLRSLAERLSGRSVTPPGTRPNPAQGRGGATAAPTVAESFADALSELF